MLSLLILQIWLPVHAIVLEPELRQITLRMGSRRSQDVLRNFLNLNMLDQKPQSCMVEGTELDESEGLLETH